MLELTVEITPNIFTKVVSDDVEKVKASHCGLCLEFAGEYQHN